MKMLFSAMVVVACFAARDASACSMTVTDPPPAQRVKTVDVFPFGLGSDCSTRGMSREFLEKRYPIGCLVIVHARSGGSLSQEVGHPSLVVSWGGQGSGLTETPVTAREVLRREVDYGSLHKLTRSEFVSQFGTETTVFDFEFHKDLARLTRARRSQRIKILERLLGYDSAPYEEMVRIYLGDTPPAARLVVQWRESHPHR